MSTSTRVPPARIRSTLENLLLCIERIVVTRTEHRGGDSLRPHRKRSSQRAGRDDNDSKFLFGFPREMGLPQGISPTQARRHDARSNRSASSGWPEVRCRILGLAGRRRAISQRFETFVQPRALHPFVVTSAADMEPMRRAPSASASKRPELPNAAEHDATG
jgi:hypothetical protein